LSASPIIFSLEDPAFRALIDLSPVAIGVSRDGIMIYGNPAYRILYGYSADEGITGRSVQEHIAPSARPSLEQRLKKRVPGAWAPEKYETRGLRKGGEEFELEASSIRVPLADGDATLVFLSDISGRKRNEESLREQEERFKALFVNAGIGMALLAMDGTAILANPALVEMLGYPEAELQRMTFDKFTHPDDVKKDRALFQELLSGKRMSYRMEKRYLHKDGRTVRGALTVSVVKGPTGKPHYAVGMVERIPDRPGPA